MKNFLKNVAAFIKELQRSDDARKKRWLYGSATAAIIVVVGLWAFYLNITILSSKRVESVKTAGGKESFFRVFTRGLGVVGAELGEKSETALGSLSRSVDAIKEQTKKSNELEIKNEDPGLFFKNLELIPPGKFPVAR